MNWLKMFNFTNVTIFLVVLIVLVVAVSVTLILLMFWYQDKTEKEIRESVFSNQFISARVFEDNWIVGGGRGRSGFAGYKYSDGPGCYVILIFDHEVQDGNWGAYDDVYVGQSVNMCKRVHSHFTGKGNGDVYADVRGGKVAYVQFRPCAKDQMNGLEKSLIAAFHATSSYNGTRGGSAVR